MKPEKVIKVIDGYRYNTETSTLIASDAYWDGHNHERSGRNTFLYRTKKGAFFAVHQSFWVGEQTRVEPLDDLEAQALYENALSEHELGWEQVFGDPEEPEPSSGRPPLYGASMRQTAIYLTAEQLGWLKAQPGTLSETVRSLVDAARGVK